MTMATRRAIIEEMERHYESPVVCYVTGDRPGLETQVGAEQLSLFPRHLEALTPRQWLNLVLYTQGGDTTAVWPIMGFLREHCQKLRIIVPYAAHSAGTLLTLGADEVVMSRFATLSPIDPTVANPYNQADPANPANKLPIAVEDVLAFLELARTTNPELTSDAFRRLADSVHPLALGNVQRSINMIRQLAKKMLELRNANLSPEETDALITRLTTQYYTHQHFINRHEALSIGLPIVKAEDDAEQIIWRYYKELCTDLSLLEKFDPAHQLRGAPSVSPGPGSPQGVQQVPGVAVATPVVPVDVERAIIETSSTCDVYKTEGVISSQIIQMPSGQQQAVAFEIVREAWERLA